MIDYFTPFWISIKLAVITVCALIIIATPLSWWLSRNKSIIKSIIESIVAMPLVLPPTVIGFYLLLSLGSNSVIGTFWYNLTGETLVFNFSGLVIGSILYSLPFAVQPLQVAFEKIDNKLIETATTLRASFFDIFYNIILPLSKKGYFTAIVLSFSHTLGEFGIVLMIGGNIPGKTQVVSIAIFEQVEQLNYAAAHIYSIIVIFISLFILIILNIINNETYVLGKKNMKHNVI
ncbi:MAG: molybdate ABC transporter permease subunit [Rickettsiaceae bacterium]|nr:molybdate ABC transporter permease subunit [Rickettsiaceae bacterium]